VVWNLKEPGPKQIIRLDYDLPDEQQFGNIANPLLAISPEGNQFVYSTTEGLYLRSVDELDARLIPGTDNSPADPFFSPDGKWVGYWSETDKQLKKIPISGGTPISIANCEQPGGSSWGADGTILYTQPYKGIMRVSANGGTPELLIETPEEVAASPRFLPNKKILLITTIGGGRLHVIAVSLESGERKELFDGGEARYLPTGHLLYSVNDTLYAVPFDPDRIEVLGARCRWSRACSDRRLCPLLSSPFPSWERWFIFREKWANPQMLSGALSGWTETEMSSRFRHHPMLMQIPIFLRMGVGWL
jgi:hypothetical protein